MISQRYASFCGKLKKKRGEKKKKKKRKKKQRKRQSAERRGKTVCVSIDESTRDLFVSREIFRVFQRKTLKKRLSRVTKFANFCAWFSRCALFMQINLISRRVVKATGHASSRNGIVGRSLRWKRERIVGNGAAVRSINSVKLLHRL